MSIISFVVTNDAEIIHHMFNGRHSQWVAFVHVGPKCTAYKHNIVNNLCVVFQHIHIGILGTLFTHIVNASIEFAMIEFVVTHDVYHMGEVKRTTLEEITEMLCPILCAAPTPRAIGNSGLIRGIVGLGVVVQILCGTNIAT